MVGILILALSTLAFSAVQHETIFPISATETTYTLEDNAYGTSDLSSGVRFSFTVPFDSAFFVTISKNNNGIFQLCTCVDNSCSSCSSSKIIGEADSSQSIGFSALSKDSIMYFKVTDYSSAYIHKDQPFEIKYSTIPYIHLTSSSPQCSTTVNSQIAMNTNYQTFTGVALPGNRTDGWKITSGTAAVKDSFANRISVSTRTDLELELQCVAATIYPLDTTFSGFVFDKNSSNNGTNKEGIITSFKASDSGYYAVFTQAANSYSFGAYKDSLLQTTIPYSTYFNIPYRAHTFYATKDSSYYFRLNQANQELVKDSIYVKIIRTIKVNSDTSGTGYVHVGTGSLSYDSTHIAGDTIPIRATSSVQRFDHWENVSGKCTILDSTEAITGIIANENCRIKAVFIPEIRYVITEKAKTYTTAENYSLGTNYSTGIRLYFTTKDSGAYIFSFENKNFHRFNLYRYTEGTYTRNVLSRVGITFDDSLYMNPGDTIFYSIKNVYPKDSLDTFSVHLTPIKHFTVTTSSQSEQCFVDTSFTTYDGKNVTITGRGEKGYRPSGWKILSGTKNILDSSSSKIQFLVKSDISIQLNCGTPNLVEIDDVWREYTVNDKLYEQNASFGIRFQYIAPTTGPIIVKAGGPTFNGTFYNYGTDSTFSMYSSITISNNYRQFYIEPQDSIRNYYFVIKANSADYDSLVGIMATKALFVQIDSTRIDSVAKGDSISVTATIPVNQKFSHWAVASGKGTFSDSSSISTYYKPKSDSSKIQPVFKQIPIFKLDSAWSTFVLDNDGVQTRFGKGIRTSYKAGDSSQTFVLQIRNPAKITFRTNYLTDSTFSFNGGYTDITDTIQKILFTPYTNDSTFHFLFYSTNVNVQFDTIQARAVAVSKITFDTTSLDTLKVNSYYTSLAKNLIPGDSVQIQVNTSTAHRFDHWKVASGSCKFADSSKTITTLYITGDCQLKTESIAGTTYKITSTPTKYTTVKNYYAASPNYGVKFLFVAPDSGTYSFVTSRPENRSVIYQRYTSSDFTQSPTKKLTSVTATEAVPMLKGDTAFFLIKNYYVADSLLPFWISYGTTSSKLIITADSNGRVSPTAYNAIINNAKYNIYGYGNANYRFDKWYVVSGKASIDDRTAPRSLVSVNGDAEIMATFRESQVVQLTTDFKTYNFKKDYYSETNNYQIRFSWTPQDTNTYILQFESVDPLTGIFTDYKDSTYSSAYKNYILNGKFAMEIKGEPGKTLYWGVRDSSTELQNKDFKARIGNKYILQVAKSLQGTTMPKGDIEVVPGKDTTIAAWAYGGYFFDKWVVDSGNVQIENAKKTKTKFAPLDTFNIIRPTFIINLTTEPELQISNIDLTNHPSVCTQVSVIDKNSGRAIVGLDSSSFILFQDDESLPLQATTIQSITGISVALVVDESGSMKKSRQDAAKIALNNFFNEMGPYDRAALVGFQGDGEVKVHQTMTSDTDSLRAAINKLTFNGNTNINEGAYFGVREVIGETNPTAVIIFSDGENGTDIVSDEVVRLANKNNTTIYTIGLESKATDPLVNLAIGTGGRYSYAATADSLADIYEDIHGILQSRYMLCFDSPDKTINNGKHEIVVKTNLNGKTSSDSITWREDNLPPKITLTQATQDMIGVSQKPGEAIVIGAYISSKFTINSAKIYLRQASIPENSFHAINMVQVNDSLWTFTIPAEDVVEPGIDFYIIAEESTGLLGKTPTVTSPSREPYTIPINNDVPTIKITNKDCFDTTSGSAKVSFAISDTNGVYKALIYYKDSLEILFNEGSLTYSSKNKNWSAKIPVEYFRDGSVAYYLRAIDSTGTAVRWPKEESKQLSACYVEPPVSDPDTTKPSVEPSYTDSIYIVNGEDSKKKISRTTEKVGIRITSKSFSSKIDTITASLKCLRSGDSESNIKMVEKKDGEYKNLKTIYKDEYSANKNNGSISCKALDTLIATYKNPETKKSVSDTVIINESVKITYQFLEVKKDEDLDSVKTSSKAKYRLRVTTTSPSIKKIDTISVKVFTHQGDSLTVSAVETDTNSSTFDYTGAFFFEDDSLALKDTLLDAVFDLTKTKNRIKIQAQYGKDSSKLSKRDSLIVYSTYVPADSAEIYDKDLDGKADYVRIHFMKPLKENIESIDTVFWPKSGKGTEYRMVKASKIEIEKDPSWVEAKLEKSFKYGVTAADSNPAPYVRFTKKKSDISQRMTLTDKVGAVPFKAEKRPGKVDVDELLQPDVVIPPDTLVITMSEKIKRTGKKDAWKKLFRYTASCEDTISNPVLSQIDPKESDSGLVWSFVLADYAIMVGNCIQTNPSAEFIGLDGNPLGKGGVKISGQDGSVYLYDISPNPAISGIGQKAEWIPPKGKKFEKVPDTLSTIKIQSIAAYKADIYIYDNQGQYVNHLKEEFGYNGELKDPLRGSSEKREKLSFLYWDQHTESGRLVGTGVYIWKIRFKFNDGHTEDRILKTGIKRNIHKKK